MTQHPHRLAGSDENLDAVAYVRDQLDASGVDDVVTLDTPVWLLDSDPEQVWLQVGGKTMSLELMRPNVIVPPVTPPGGLTGPVVYLGDGESPDARHANLQGAIAVLDYGVVPDAWHRAFERGAKAVIFLSGNHGASGDASRFIKHASVPVNFPRFYAPPADHDTEPVIDLTQAHPRATLHAAAQWRPRHAPSVFAMIRGTDPAANADGVIVLSAALDSLGSVPHRSPGARQAGNAAILLRAARRWADDPPRQDVLLVFFNGQSVGLEASRVFYDTLTLNPDELEDQQANHQAEAEHLETLRASLDAAIQDKARIGDDDALRRLLQREADAAAADLAQRRRTLRLDLSNPDKDTARIEQQLKETASRVQQWDALRRALHNPDAASDDQLADSPVREEVLERAAAFVRQSEQSVADARRIDRQRAALRELIAPEADREPRVRLHIDLELSGDSTTWGAYLGNDTDDFTQARAVRPSGDAPGYYATVLAHLRGSLPENVGTTDDEWAGLDPRTLRDPWGGRRLVPAEIPTAGTLAGHHAFLHLALTNLHDARPREGQPADTADRLDLPRFFKQGDAALRLIRAAIDRPGLPRRGTFTNHTLRRVPAWSPRGSDGPSAQRWVVGGLSEDRPAAGVMIAVWPTHEGDWGRDNAWRIHAQSGLSYYEPARRLRTNANGRYALPALHDELDQHFVTLAADFDAQGQVNAITTWETMLANLTATPRTDLLPARGDAVVFRPHEYNDAQPLTVLLPHRDTRPRGNASIRGKLSPFGFVYLHPSQDVEHASFFQAGGAVRLEFDAPEGEADAKPTRDAALFSARNLWTLDEDRLAQLRRRAIIREDLEGLHRRGRDALPKPDDLAGTTDAHDAGTSARLSYALSRRVYLPLRSTMNDLVAGIVVLLGLTIPFSFALERLVVGASSIHGRVAGFSACFLLTFVLLYLTHPGFAIATAPVLIFLAFTILLLSALVIVLLTRKFRVELAAMHGQGAGSHKLETSHAATLVAAIQIGISTMRRRKTRTALTLLTVTVLTFTVVCFAGFEPKLAIRTTPLGPTPDTAPPEALLVRSPDYSELPPALRELTREALAGNNVTAEPIVWWSGISLALARDDGTADTQARAVIGLTPDTVQRWPALAAALNSEGSTDPKQIADALSGDGVLLPPRLARSLDLDVGDVIRIEGVRATVTGTFDPDGLTRLRHLDNRPLLPVDFLDAASTLIAGAGSDGIMAGEFNAQEFQYLSATQTIVGGADFTRKLGGDTHLLTVFTQDTEARDRMPDDLARAVTVPVWSAGTTGLERRTLGVTAALDAGPSLFVPLILGGLIVFGTLLGSITDRKEEIATFSALGLGPAHVGALFVAEAAVYAIVGGMGGQLLAQVLAASAQALSDAGIGRPLPINYASSNALLAITAVGITVMISALYPAWRAARSANPGVERAWKPPKPKDGKLDARLPFTLSAYDMTGVMAFLAEHLAAHRDAGLGRFATQAVALREGSDGRPELFAEVALAPFDLGVTQEFSLSPTPTDLPGVDEVAVTATRTSGSTGDWNRTNRVFLRDLRRQFLLWRTLSPQAIQRYRDEALRSMGSGERQSSSERQGGGE